MSITNYSELKTSVANWLHRSDLTSNIPDFIQLAEYRMARDLRISPLLSTSTVTIAAAGSSVALPTGYLEMVNVEIDGGAELHYVPPDTIDRIDGSGTPWVYTLKGETINVAPSWTAGGDLSLTYYKKETALSDSSTTNWYINNAPDALLYASLLEASPYLVSDNRIDVWFEFYNRAIESLNRQYGNIDPHRRMLNYAATPVSVPGK